MQRASKILFFVILLIGVIMRVYQYCMGRSIWEDEAHLALNFMNYGFKRLAQPLDYIQAAPIFFLWSVKMITKIFGESELAFRFVPFFCSVATLPLFYFIIRKLVNSKIAALCGFFFFAVNLAVIYFSSELKQYAVDVSVYLFLIFITIPTSPWIVNYRLALLAIAGCAAIFFSNVSVIILFCIGCYSLYSYVAEKRIRWKELVVFAIWILAFVINYFLFIHDHPSTADQKLNYAFAFCPQEILSEEFITFLKKTIDETFFDMLLLVWRDFYFSYVLLLLFFCGIFAAFYKRQTGFIFLVILPILVHLTLSSFKMYPFWYRLILYLVPCFLFIIANGLAAVYSFLSRKIHSVPAIIFLVYCCYFLTIKNISGYPSWPREIKPALAFVNDSATAGAHVYVTDPEHAYEYYNRRHFVNSPMHSRVEWTIDPPEFYEMIGQEKKNYLLFYGTVFQWGYADVIEDLNAKGLVVRRFEAGGYGVMEIRPMEEPGQQLFLFDHTSFDPSFRLPDMNLVALWSGSVETKPVYLLKGSYKMQILSHGTSVDQVYGIQKVYVNSKEIGEFRTYKMKSRATIEFEVEKSDSVRVKFQLMNDALNDHEDINTFISTIEILQ